MNKRLVILSIIVLLLVGFWLYAFSGLFESKQIQIVAQLKRPRHHNRTVYPVIFGFNRDFVLESLKVVPVDSPNQKPLWHLVYDKKFQERVKRWAKKHPNRVEYPHRIQSLTYGRRIRGLKPASEDDKHAKPLQPDTPYRLIVNTRSGHGEVEFQTRRLKRNK